MHNWRYLLLLFIYFFWGGWGRGTDRQTVIVTLWLTESEKEYSLGGKRVCLEWLRLVLNYILVIENSETPIISGERYNLLNFHSLSFRAFTRKIMISPKKSITLARFICSVLLCSNIENFSPSKYFCCCIYFTGSNFSWKHYSISTFTNL